MHDAVPDEEAESKLVVRVPVSCISVSLSRHHYTVGGSRGVFYEIVFASPFNFDDNTFRCLSEKEHADKFRVGDEYYLEIRKR